MAFLGVFGAIGLGRFGYSAILPSMQEALGISTAAAGSLASWNLAGYVLSAAVGGILASRFGPRVVVTAGSIVAALGMFITGISEGMVAASGGRFLTGVGAGTVLVPSVALMSAWFDVRRRGMASGIVSSGASLALVIAGPVVPRIIENSADDGWRYAWYFFAALTLAMGIVTFIVQRNRPYTAPHALAGEGSIWTAEPSRAMSAGRDDEGMAAALAAWKPAPVTIRTGSTVGMKNVVSSRYAWHMGFVYMAFGLAYMIYFTFFQKRLMADLELTSATAGNLFLIVGVASIFCGFLWGAISDRVGRGRALAGNLLLQGVAAALFAWWPSMPGLVISALLCGLTALAVPGIVGAGCGDQFGPRLASASLGFVTIFIGVGQVVGPYLAGQMADSFGSLKYSYVLSAGIFFAGAILAVFLREAGWAAETRARGATPSADGQSAGRAGA